MNDEIEDLKRKLAAAEENAKFAWQTANINERARQEEMKKRDALQAQLDALMIEYCPADMTEQQLQTWARNQRPISKEEAAEINRILLDDKGN